MSKQEAKFCPLFFPGGYDLTVCKLQKCMWFIDGQCAIAVIARFIISLDRELEALV
jgi:hypothetical protein